MKFIISINGTNVLFTSEHVNVLAGLIEEAEILDNKYMGAGLGTNGGNYMDVLAPVVLRDVLKPGVISDTTYESLVFITKQLADAAKK